MAPIPVTILTGFLGAGKTTLLNRLISQAGFRNTAVVVNEFGEAGVDGALIAKADERAFAMTTGCLCCTVMGDVRLTLLRLLDEAERGLGPSFDRVVIETTGLADPAPVLQTFMADGAMLAHFTLNGVVTLVDAINGSGAIESYGEAYRQAAVADLILVTKGDLAHTTPSRNDLIDLKRRLTEINPNAHVLEANEATTDTIFSLATFDLSGRPPDVRSWLRFNEEEDRASDHHHGHAHDHHHNVNTHSDTASAYCFAATGPVDPWALEKAVIALQTAFGPNLLRVKGLVELAGYPSSPRLLHVVGHISIPPRLLNGWPDGIDETRLVVIVGGPDRSVVPDILDMFLPELCSFRRETHAAFDKTA